MAAAAVATVGAALLTVTAALPLTVPLVAVTLAEPVAAGAVYSPPALIEPMPLALAQVKRRLAAKATPNWSFPVAVNCCVWFSFSVARAPGSPRCW